jgi:type IV pilus assembly protein PilM
MPNTNFYHDGPLFGLDIGHSNLKVMQIDNQHGKKPHVLGYGARKYLTESISNGVIVDHDALAEALSELLRQDLVGSISTHRVACTIPTSRTFSRPMKLPPMEDKDIAEAVNLEAEQYIPIPQANLYIDYEIAKRDDSGIELLMVAMPKNVIDSYIKFLESVALEPVALEPTMNAAARLFSLADSSSNQPSILVDFGSIAIDLAVLDKTMFVNSTVLGGSDTITDLIAKRLAIKTEEAYEIKNKDGIGPGPKQQAIIEAIKPTLDSLVREIQKIVRYYNERQDQSRRKIAQILTIGGGVNMPGLNEYLVQELHLPTRNLSPWDKLNFGNLPLPGSADLSMFVTVAGEAILKPQEILS